MTRLETIFSSNIPVDCYILKGRLETEGLDCFIFDEHIVWAHPFRAVAIGGVKLKVPVDQIQSAYKITSLIESAELIDKEGKYDLSIALDHEINKQNEVLKLKTMIRNDPSLLEKKLDHNFELLSQTEIDRLLNSEKEFQLLANKKFHFSSRQFWYELFDFDRSVFNYLRIRPPEFYIEQDLVSNFNLQTVATAGVKCPKCNSGNVRYGYAIDFKLDLLYLILSFLVSIPFPMLRKNYHCFNCNYNFKKINSSSQ